MLWFAWKENEIDSDSDFACLSCVFVAFVL